MKSETYGQSVARRRTAARLSPSRFAAAVGTSTDYLRRLERDVREPSEKMRERIASFFASVERADKAAKAGGSGGSDVAPGPGRGTYACVKEWLDTVATVRRSDAGPHVYALLVLAREAGLTLDDVIGALR